MAAQQVLQVLEEIDFHYPDDEEVRYRIPAGLGLGLGESWWIRGESGWGKSTLMTLLAALRRFGRGRIHYRLGGEEQPTEVSPDSWRRQVGPALWGRMGFAFQRPELLGALNVRDNLELAVGPRKEIPLFDHDEWQSIKHSPVWEISGGQVQRLGLMRAFAPGQDLVFLDEPTNNLDRRNREQVAAFVESERRYRGLVVVSHDAAFIESLSIDRIFNVEQVADDAGHLHRRLVEDQGLSPSPARGGGSPRN